MGTTRGHPRCTSCGDRLLLAEQVRFNNGKITESFPACGNCGEALGMQELDQLIDAALDAE